MATEFLRIYGISSCLLSRMKCTAKEDLCVMAGLSFPEEHVCWKDENILEGLGLLGLSVRSQNLAEAEPRVDRRQIASNII
jgi:hypothetical protein